MKLTHEQEIDITMKTLKDTIEDKDQAMGFDGFDDVKRILEVMNDLQGFYESEVGEVAAGHFADAKDYISDNF